MQIIIIILMYTQQIQTMQANDELCLLRKQQQQQNKQTNKQKTNKTQTTNVTWRRI